jgi:hypothetical protein
MTMDDRSVSIEVYIEHPDCPDRISAAVVIPANEFGPDVLRHMCEALYGTIKERALKGQPVILMPKKRELLQ